MLETLRKFEQNSEWANANASKLRGHANRYVAIDEGQILAVADDIRELYRQFAGKREVFITFVAPEGMAWVL